MNLWTIGRADPRLTAKTRSPVGKPGKTKRVFQALPTGRRLPTSFTAPQQPQGLILNLFPGIMFTSSRAPALAYSPPEPVQLTGTVAPPRQVTVRYDFATDATSQVKRLATLNAMLQRRGSGKTYLVATSDRSCHIGQDVILCAASERRHRPKCDNVALHLAKIAIFHQ